MRQHVNFNPRSHEGSDDIPPRPDARHPISIHAPTKGATSFSRIRSLIAVISIHAPTKGATLLDANMVYYNYNFNPRSHEGSDTISIAAVRFTIISIHAPTKGATRAMHGCPLHCPYFNPRSHEGSDSFFFCFLEICGAFQSTLPRRERLDKILIIY